MAGLIRVVTSVDQGHLLKLFVVAFNWSNARLAHAIVVWRGATKFVYGVGFGALRSGRHSKKPLNRHSPLVRPLFISLRIKLGFGFWP